jgi:PAS domain S-box-containing protein
MWNRKLVAEVKKKIIDKLSEGQRLTRSEIELIEDALEKKGEKGHSALYGAVADGSIILSGSADFLDALNKVFRLIGEATGVDRIYFFENHADPSTGDMLSSQKIEWARDRVEAFIDSPELQNLPFAMYGDFLNPLFDGKPVTLVVEQLDDGPLKELLGAQDIKTLLALPVNIKGEMHGFIGFDDCTKVKLWSADEISSLQIIASHLSNLVEKEQVRLQLAKTYRQARIGTWRMDLLNDTFYWSPITREIFELKEHEEPDRDMAYSMFVNDADLKDVLGAIEHAMATGESYDKEIEIITRKGNRKWIRDTGQVEFLNGKPVSIHGTVQDIDEQKKAIIESEKNKKLLNAITDQAQVAIFVRRINGEQLFANREWKRLFGFENKNVIGKNLFELFDEEIAAHISKTDKQVFEKGTQYLFEEKVFTVHGPRYFMVNKFPIKGIAGMESAVGGIGTDITNIKETEERLQAAEQKLRDVVEHSTNLFYSHDTDHHLVYVSPQSVRFFGVNPAVAKRRWTEFVTDNPANEKGFELTEKAIRTGNPQPPYELELRRDDGTTFWAEVNEAPIVKDGKTVLITGSLTDVTDRKRVEIEIHNSLKEKETLLAEIHHRVKNNLAVVASMMQMQAHITEDEKLADSLLESVLRIKSMANIHEYLYRSQNFSEIDFSVNLRDLINSIINTMRFQKQINVDFNCDNVHLNVNQAIPTSLIVNEVVTNIIKHAFKEEDDGQISVILKNEENGQIRLQIADDGIGLPKGFDPESENTLGMQLIKTLSEQLGGTYSYFSEGRGCSFSLEFRKLTYEAGGELTFT